MIEVKEAISTAFTLFRELVQEAGGMRQANHLLLEEVELTNDVWEVVIGFDAGRMKKSRPNGILAGFEGAVEEPIREFRRIYIDAKTGEFISIK